MSRVRIFEQVEIFSDNYSRKGVAFDQLDNNYLEQVAKGALVGMDWVEEFLVSKFGQQNLVLQELSNIELILVIFLFFPLILVFRLYFLEHSETSKVTLAWFAIRQGIHVQMDAGLRI